LIMAQVDTIILSDTCKEKIYIKEHKGLINVSKTRR